MTSQEGTAGIEGYSWGHNMLEVQTAVGLKLWLLILMESPSHITLMLSSQLETPPIILACSFPTVLQEPAHCPLSF